MTRDALGVRLFTKDDPGAKHFASFWLMQANSPSNELWLRVVSLAYGSHRANGHAPFKQGDLSQFFQRSSSQVCTAIGTAKARGFLAGESSIRCLVVPHDQITGGLGHPHDPCGYHGRIYTRCET